MSYFIDKIGDVKMQESIKTMLMYTNVLAYLPKSDGDMPFI